MPRLKPAEVALLLERLRGQFPMEVGQLEKHLDAAETEDGLLALVREMVESKEQSKAAELDTAKTLMALKPIIEASAAALSKLAEEEKRRNDLTQRELDRQDKLDERQGKLEEGKQEMKKISLREIIVPIVTALVAAFSAWAAMHFGG